MKHLILVLDIFEKFNLKINIEKYQFMREKVHVLGHVISKEGLKTDDKKIITIKLWVISNNVSELKSFLGTIGYYREFINQFAQVAAPLTKLLRKGTTFNINKEETTSFNNLKECLIKAPI